MKKLLKERVLFLCVRCRRIGSETGAYQVPWHISQEQYSNSNAKQNRTKLIPICGRCLMSLDDKIPLKKQLIR